MPVTVDRRSWIWGGGLLLLFALLLGSLIQNRSIFYDEAITLLETSGHRTPDWPRETVSAGELQRLFEDRSEPWPLFRDSLRSVHPPLYFMLALVWRHLFGSGLEALRWMSALLALAQAGLFFHYCSRLRYPAAAGALFCTAAVVVFFGYATRGYVLACLMLLCAMAASTGATTRFKAGATILAAGAAVGTH